MNKLVKSLVALSVASACHVVSVSAATYEVVDRGDVNSLKYTYSLKVNTLGEAAVAGTDIYNFPVQFQYFDQDDFNDVENLARNQHEFVHELNDLEDKTLLEAGTPTANDLAWAVRLLDARSSNSLYQKVGNTVAMVHDGTQSREFRIFDQTFEGTDVLTRSTIDYINGITDAGWVYGSGSSPFLPFPFTESDGDDVVHWVRSFLDRGYISTVKGTTIMPVIAPETSYAGGVSGVLDIEGLTAVGYASTALNQELVDEWITDECEDPDFIDDTPAQVCIQGQASNLYHVSAYKWILNEDGTTASGENLGLMVTPHENDDRVYNSYAQAINSHGVVVGYSHGWVDETVTEPADNQGRSFYAAVFRNGEVISFTPDHSEYFDSRAYDINDNGYAVGHITRWVSGNLRTKFFFVDTNADAGEMELTLPTDFFNGSSSTARAINEQNIVVGEGEFETHNDSTSNPRRTHAFMYNIDTNVFTDLNDFLSCTSPYTIIEARDINDDNEISATAIVKEPRRDAKGELMLDEDGNQLTEDVVRAVTLRPIAGEVEDCSAVEEKVERQGAGFGFGLVGLLAFFGLRRFRK